MKLKLKYLLLTAMFIVSMVARGQDFNPEDPIEPAATPINLKVVVVPAGAGTVKGGGKYKAGTSVTLSTTRNEGYVFLHWEDSKGNILSESTQFTYVKKSYEEVITARYKEIPHLRVKVSPEGAGSVSGGGQYDAGTKVKVNTSGNTGFVFKCWTNEAGDTLAMTQSYEHTKLDVNEVLIANYQFEPGNPIEPSEPSLPEPPVVIPKYNLTLHATEGGNVTGGGMYEEGTSVKVKATANTGFYFKGWLNQAGDTVSATAEFTYAMQAMDTTFVAHFEFNPSAPIEPSEPNITPPAPVLPSYSVSVLTTEGGSVTSTHTSAKEGVTVTIKATVQTGFVFAGWFNADTLVTMNTSYSFVMGHEAVEYLAKFEFNPSGPIEPNVPSMKDNSLYLMTIAAKPGDAAECVVYFNAIKEITDLTFQLGFPKGIALQSESLNISTNVQGYTIDYTLKNDSTIVFNMTGGKLDVGNVKLLSMTVNVPEEYPVGVGNKVSVNQVSVSYPDGTSSTVSTRNSSLDVYKYGDADNSGVIDVVDLIMARDFYYGVYIDGFEYVAVDLNRNGVVDSEDINMLKQLILEQAYETVVPKSRSIDATGKNVQTAFDVKFSSYNVVKDSVAMNLYLSADNAIKGFQLDVELPSSLTFNEVAPQMMKDWSRFDVDFKAVSNRKMRLLVTSGSNAMFPIGETNVLSCNVNVNKLQLDSLTLSDGVVVKDDYSTLKSEGKFPTYSKSKLYCITYKVDGKIYKTDSISYGATIVPPTTPTKEGHTFIGWDGLPDVMPAKDVEVSALFDVNVYRITYKVDGKTHQTDSIAYGATIVPPTVPTKTGHSFTGWDGLPETMPAKDVEVTAKFDVNVYRITYKVDGKTYQTDSIAYGTTIVQAEAPTKEGYLFDGWDGLPDVMPAKDVEVTAKYSLNSVQTDEQGVRYELNAVSNTFEAKGTTDELVADIVLPATIYDVPVSGIAAEAFKDAEIQTIVIPATIQEVGDDAFVGCTELRWVDWQAQAQARAECFDTPEAHGNMLLFCYGEQTSDYAGNVVVNGKAKEIVLIDARPYASPYDYEAENISFTKTFTKETMIGTGAGWEGIVVPFDVERIVFGDKVIAPFGATGQYSDIPCWLAQMKDENFVMTDAIRADEAYIMAVPNSEAYDDDYNVEGDVRFEATKVRLKATSQMPTTPSGGLGLVGTYEPVEAAANVFTLNDEEYWKTYDGMMAPGSVFVQGLRDVRPFEAYVRSTKALHMACLKIGNVLPTNIAGIQNDSADAEAWYTLQGKRLNTKPVHTGFYLHGGKLEFVRQR